MKKNYLTLAIIVLSCAAAFGQAPDKSDTVDSARSPVVAADSVSITPVRREAFPNPLARSADTHGTASRSTVGDNAARTPETSRRSAGDSDVHYEITPYGWLSGIQGNLRVRNTPVRIDSNGFEVIKSVDFAFGIRGEVSKGRLGGFIDEDYANLGTSGHFNGPLATPYDVQPTINIFEVGPSYTLYFIPNSDNSLPDKFSVEALGGLRWFHLGLGLKAGNNVDLEGSRNIVDFFGGARLKVRPDPKVTLSTRVTLGGGGSSSAWTVNGLIDWRFRPNVSVMGGYQVLDMNADDLNNTVGFDGRLKGLIFGLTFYR